MKQIYDNKDIGEIIDKSFDAGIKEGYRRCREQMMKGAVEGEYDFYPAAVYLDVPIPRMNHGDKVRVIVIPNTDEK